VDGFLQIKIEVQVDNDCLEFEIANSFINEDNAHRNGGLGLLNIRKRLDLNYPRNYELTHEIKENWYSAKLVICDLAKNEQSNRKDE
jgi:LytS/YehU family sensor histidine kinase